MLSKHSVKKSNNFIKKIKIEDAVGTLLAHDVTEVRPGEFKGTAFNAGHVIQENDLDYLRRIGKRHVFVLELSDDHIHENDAVVKLASELLGGKSVKVESFAKEGKIHLKSNYKGLFKVHSEALFKINMIPEIMCSSLHDNTVVSENRIVAVIKVNPLFIKNSILKKTVTLVDSYKPIFEIKPFLPLSTRLIITGSEVYDGLINDGFEKIIRKKLEQYDISLLETIILPDDSDHISEMVKNFLNRGTDLLITTGGMSVDPDDLTRYGICSAGADKVYYGAAVTPGSMFQLAYFSENMIAMSIPACALYHKTTIFDLIFPRILTGERLDDEDLARFGHGGLCLGCEECNYPCCPFGKN